MGCLPVRFADGYRVANPVLRFQLKNMSLKPVPPGRFIGIGFEPNGWPGILLAAPTGILDVKARLETLKTSWGKRL